MGYILTPPKPKCPKNRELVFNQTFSFLDPGLRRDYLALHDDYVGAYCDFYRQAPPPEFAEKPRMMTAVPKYVKCHRCATYTKKTEKRKTLCKACSA